MKCDWCPVPSPRPCAFEGSSGHCGKVRDDPAWRDAAIEHDRQRVEGGGHVPPTPEERASLLARVRECPSRGSVLPVSRQAECGCGGELSECRAGLGDPPGAVTLARCLECVGGPAGARR